MVCYLNVSWLRISKQLGVLVYLSIFFDLDNDIGAPGVLLDVIEQKHGDRVCGGGLDFVRHVPSPYLEKILEG